MKCKFPDRDLSQRLDSTVCRYQGQPVWVRYHDVQTLALYSLASGGKKLITNIRSDHPDFDISSVPLGFVQITDSLVGYFTRRPNRIYKQGLSADSVGVKYISRDPKLLAGGHGMLLTQAFENMVNNNYPSLDKAMYDLRRSDKEREIAISRDIALSVNPNLKLVYVHYKAEKDVGWIPPDTNIVIIPSSEEAWIISKYLSSFAWEVR